MVLLRALRRSASCRDLCQAGKAYSLREQGKKKSGDMNDMSLYGPPLIYVLLCSQIPVQRQAVMESWGNKFSAIPEHSGDKQGLLEKP